LPFADGAMIGRGGGNGG